jgi:hypothetical protein
LWAVALPAAAADRAQQASKARGGTPEYLTQRRRRSAATVRETRGKPKVPYGRTFPKYG